MIHTLNPIPPNRNQKPNLCAATCLQMILGRRGIEYGYSLENLAVQLGLYIDEEDKDMFGEELRRRTLKHGSAEIGLLFDDFKKPEKLGLIKSIWGIDAKVLHPSEIGIRKIKDFLVAEIEKGNDIMLNYRLEPFNGRTDGHYVLMFALNEDTNDIYVSDPSPFVQEYWKAKLGRFLWAMKPRWKEDDNKKRERGFVIFSGPMNKEKDNPQSVDNLVMGVGDYVAVDARIDKRTPFPVPYQSTRNRPSQGN